MSNSRPQELITIRTVKVCRDCFDASHFDRKFLGEERWAELKASRDVIAKAEGEFFGYSGERLGPFECLEPCDLCRCDVQTELYHGELRQWHSVEPKRTDRFTIAGFFARLFGL